MVDRPEGATPIGSPLMKGTKGVTILGGGLAGLAAAVVLSDEGFQVTLVERKPFLGARASSYSIPNSPLVSSPLQSATERDEGSALESHDENGLFIDNCQHVLMRCCTNLLDFYRRLAVDQGIKFYDRYTLIDEEGRLAYLQGS